MQLDISLKQSKTAFRQITETEILQGVWSHKGLKQKVTALHGKVASNKIKIFDQKKKKLMASFTSLTGEELNMLATDLASLPVHIQEFAVTRVDREYDLRCTCSW